MKREPKIFIIAIISLIFLFTVLQAQAQENTAEGNKVAVVNGTVISQDQFDREMIPVQEVIDASGKTLTTTDIATIKKSVLEKIIKNELLYQECQKNNVQINDEEINKRFEATKSQFASDSEFQQRLTQLNSSEELLKSQIKKELAIQRLINQKFKPTITDQEIKAYYDGNPDKFKNEAGGTIKYEEAKEDIRKTLGKEKIADSYNNFYAEVREKAKVDIYLKE